MPIHDFSRGSCKVARYDVVGKHSNTQSQFVEHVALHNAEAEISQGQRVGVAHMGPPLETDGEIIAYAAGCVPLRISETRQIAVWIEKIKDEYDEGEIADKRREQYCIHPPWKDHLDPNTGVRRHRKYSCAGFVLDSHRRVEIHLLELDDQALPIVNEVTIKRAYPIVARRPGLLEEFGIQPDEEWRVVLAGYVMHALNRSEAEIRARPYRAKPGDEHF